MIVDFHCHSTVSDGELSPIELVQRAEQQGVELMAITDHDSIDGFLDVKEHSGLRAPRLIAGVELSCVWGKVLVHIVGLNIDTDCTQLREALVSQQQARLKRAELIGTKLEKYGFHGGFQYAADLAGISQIGRPHFAQFLLDRGYVRSIDEAFKKYLGAGKPGDIKLTWPAMTTVLNWIKTSGGVGVLAHPLHYKMTATKLRTLMSDFKQAGGEGLEVISGKQTGDRTQYLAQLAQQFDLLASIGSDFHRPGMPWRELGQMGSLPSGCKPIWLAW
ncbi:MAG: PHP domain-containing protein [Pseudomonadales bacterium]